MTIVRNDIMKRQSPDPRKHIWIKVKESGKLTLADKWHCSGCDTTIKSINSSNPAHIARTSGIDEDCHVQMVRNVMEK